MKILAFGASNSSTSINRQLAIYTSSLFEGAEVTTLDLNDFEMPIFSVDREKATGYPDAVHQFLAAIGNTDLIILSMAENNGSYSTAFKNIFDWASRVEGKTFQNKVMFLLATSPGARGGISVLEAAKTRFPFHAANVLASFSLPEFNKNFDPQTGIAEGPIKDQFLEQVAIVKAHFGL